MPLKEIQENWQAFSRLIEELPNVKDEQMNLFFNHYIEQNITLLNDIFAVSIDNLHKLQKAKSANDVICTQARFSNEVSKKLSMSTKRFLNASLGQIADYNEWLKTHCDFATD